MESPNFSLTTPPQIIIGDPSFPSGPRIFVADPQIFIGKPRFSNENLAKALVLECIMEWFLKSWNVPSSTPRFSLEPLRFPMKTLQNWRFKTKILSLQCKSIGGLQWKLGDLQWKSVGLQLKSWGLPNILGSTMKIWMSPKKIWGLQWISWGLQWKSGGLRQKNLWSRCKAWCHQG